MKAIHRKDSIINLKQIWSVEKQNDGEWVILFYNAGNNSRMVFETKADRDNAWDDIIYEMDAEEV